MVARRVWIPSCEVQILARLNLFRMIDLSGGLKQMFRKDRLANLMTERGMKQVDLAKAIGCSPVAVNRYLHGGRVPRPGLLARIAVVLDTTTDYLMGGADPNAIDLGLNEVTFGRALYLIRIFGDNWATEMHRVLIDEIARKVSQRNEDDRRN